MLKQNIAKLLIGAFPCAYCKEYFCPDELYAWAPSAPPLHHTFSASTRSTWHSFSVAEIQEKVPGRYFRGACYYLLCEKCSRKTPRGSLTAAHVIR